MAAAGRKTDEVLASARKELQAQLDVVREEQARLAAEERALTEALTSLNGGSSSSSTDGRAGGASAPRSRAAKNRSATRRATSGRRRQKRGGGKSTADRLEELRGLLVAGPRSRDDLAAALKVSPARVQQLLAELGSAVSSKPDPERGRAKLWTLKGSGNGAGAAKSEGKRATGGPKRTSSSPTSSGKATAPK